MRIDVNSLDIAYKILTHFPVTNCGEREEKWKASLREESEDENEELRRVGGFRYPYIELPKPLRHIELHIRRSFNSYSSYFLLSAWKPSAFYGVSEIFKERLKNMGLDFKEFNDFQDSTFSGIGAIVNPHLETGHENRDKHYLHIMRAGKKGEMRDIGMGCNGAYQRTFPNCYEDFKLDFVDPKKGLLSITNKFIEACYCEEILHKKIELPDITLYLNP